MFAKIVEFLRKIGVISAGTTSYSGDASKRTVGMMDGGTDLQAIDKENREKKKE